jgi:metal-responsive CopG/Arc/MetJ family transcriptional regulator
MNAAIVTTKKPKISIYLSEEQKGELDEWAKEEKRSVSNLISVLVDDALESRKQRKKKKDS